MFLTDMSVCPSIEKRILDTILDTVNLRYDLRYGKTLGVYVYKLYKL